MTNNIRGNRTGIKAIREFANQMKLSEFIIALSPLDIHQFDFYCRIYLKDLGAIFLPD